MGNDVSRLLGLPYSEEAEEAVLSAAIWSSEAADYVISRLSVDDFYDPHNRKVYEVVVDMATEGAVIDPVTVKDRVERVHGQGYVETMVDLACNSMCSSPIQWVAAHCDIVARDSVSRRTVMACEKVAAMARETYGSAEEVAGFVEEAFAGVTDAETPGFAAVDEGLNEAMAALMAASDGTRAGLATGFEELDGILCGIQPQNLAVVAARPGVGKTAFALNVALNAAKAGVPVLLFSLEMSTAEIFGRLLCMHSGVPMSRIRKGCAGTGALAKLEASRRELAELEIHVDDSAMLTTGQIRAKASRKVKELRRSRKCDPVVIVDYVQLVKTPEGQNTRAYELAQVTRGLKMLAKDLQVPVVALSQLNRQVETRATKRPVLSDLRESGAIEQDADIVMFLDRSMNAEEARDEQRPEEGEAKVIVAKHRNGEIGDASMEFDGSTMRFTEFDCSRPYTAVSDNGIEQSIVYEGC